MPLIISKEEYMLKRTLKRKQEEKTPLKRSLKRISQSESEQEENIPFVLDKSTNNKPLTSQELTNAKIIEGYLINGTLLLFLDTGIRKAKIYCSKYLIEEDKNNA